MRARQFVSSAIVASILVISGAVARAEPAGGGTDAIARGRELVRSFEYDAAIVELESVLADETSTAPERIEALELMALLQMNLRRQARARELFERLLTLDPGHELTDPEIPPRAVDLFTKTRTGFVPSARTTVETRSAGAAGGTVDIEADAGGSTGGVDRAVAYLRGPGETAYRRAPMTRRGLRFTASVPAPPGGAVDYYVEVQAPSGHVLASAGSADSPLRVELSPAVGADPALAAGLDDAGGEEASSGRARRRWYRSWWFWTIVGVAVAGGATTAVVLTRPEEQPRGSLGSLDLP